MKKRSDVKEYFMNERFGLTPSGMFVRDYKHWKSYDDIDDKIALMNKVNKSDNCAIDIIKKNNLQNKKLKMLKLF